MLGILASQFFQPFFALRPGAVSGIGIDVAGTTDVDEFTAPIGGKHFGAVKGDVGVVFAGDDKRAEWQTLKGHGGETYSPGGIRGSFYVARADEHRGVHAIVVRVSGCPVNDGGATGAVADEDEGTSGGGKSLVEGGDPIGAARGIPIFLLHAVVVGMMRLPDALPVFRAGVV